MEGLHFWPQKGFWNERTFYGHDGVHIQVIYRIGQNQYCIGYSGFLFYPELSNSWILFIYVILLLI